MSWKIYCDGSCRNNGYENAYGAYAYVVLDEDENIVHCECIGGPEINTNNRAEMLAMIKALEYWDENLEGSVEVNSDSAYVVNAYRQGWVNNWKYNGWKTANKQPVKNQDLWIELDSFFQRKDVELIKVKGHADNRWNIFVDNMAQRRSLANGESDCD